MGFQIREQRKEELAQHVAEFNAELRKQSLDGSDAESVTEEVPKIEERDGTADDVPEIEQDEEYVDEDKYTTVTVEAMDLANGNDGGDSEAVEGVKDDAARVKAPEKKKRRPKDPTATKAKKKKFRYESKAERQATRSKQKSKNSAAKARRIAK